MERSVSVCGPGDAGWTSALLAVAAGMLAAAPTAAPAQEAAAPLVTDRPDFTESAVAVEPGRVQLEAGYTYSRDGPARIHDVGEALVRVGALPGAELRIAPGSLGVLRPAGDRDAEVGLRDAVLGAKIELPGLSGRRAGLRAAVLASATLPTGTGPVAEEGVRPEARLALGWDPLPRVGVGANLGYAHASDGGRRFDELTASGALSYGVSDATGVYVEYFGLYRPAGGPGDENFLDGGVTRRLGPDLQLDARLGVGLDGPDPDYLVGVGVSVRR